MTYSQDGFTPDPATPLYEGISQQQNTYPGEQQTGYADQSGSTDEGASGKADTAKQEAAGVAHDARDAAGSVAGTAKEQGKRVTSEATSQVRGLLGQAGSELKSQAGTQQDRVAQGIRSVGQNLKSMADNADSGPATSIVSAVADRADSAAGWLEGRDPASLLSEVRSFAARRPGTFIAIAAVAGVVAGRLTSSLVSEAKEHAQEKAADADTSSTTGTTGYAGTYAPQTTPPVPPVPSPETAAGGIYPGTTTYPTQGYATGEGYPGTEGGRL